MLIKMIVLDMDGTLLNKEDKILPETKAALIDFQKVGGVVCLASGRPYGRMYSYALELKMDEYHGYLIEVNGLCITDVARDHREKFNDISIEEGKELIREGMHQGVEAMLVGDDFIYDYIPEAIMEKKRKIHADLNLDEDHPWTAGPYTMLSDLRKGYPNIHYIKDDKEVEVACNKICYGEEPDVIEELYYQLKEKYQNRFWVGRTTDRWLEICPIENTKAIKLQILAERLKISMEHIMAFGDGENDLDMLTSVGCGVAMGNALQTVKDKVDYVTDSNNENGIVNAMKKIII